MQKACARNLQKNQLVLKHLLQSLKEMMIWNSIRFLTCSDQDLLLLHQADHPYL